MNNRWKQFIDIIKPNRFENNTIKSDILKCSESAEKNNFNYCSFHDTSNVVVIYAKEDSPRKFSSIKKEYYKISIDELKVNTTYDIASIIRMYIEGIYIRSDNKYYHYHKGKWEIITSTFKSLIRKELIVLRGISDSMLLEIDKETDKEKYSIIKDLYIKLGDIGFTNKIIDELNTMITISPQEFSERFDNKISLVLFNNGVYDLELLEFRDHSPNDFLTISTNYCYNQEPNEENIDFVLDRFEEFFPDHCLCEWMLYKIASMFYGRNSSQEFYIFQGIGSNGKSVLLELINKLLGEYSTTVSVSLLTNKRGKSAEASPDLAKTVGRRLITMQEPDHNSSIQPGLLKELTGCDRITARALYSSPIEFVPQFKMILCCNDLPSLNGVDDEGTWRRMRIIPFESRFLDNIPEGSHNCFKRDSQIINKMKECVPDFIHYLLNECYNKFVICPERVKARTNEYRADADLIQEFVNCCIEQCDNNIVLSATEIYEVYKQFIYDNYSPKELETKRTFMRKIKSKLNESLSGYKLK